MVANSSNPALYSIYCHTHVASGKRYVGLTNTAMAPFLLISPLLGGFIADRLNYSATFATAAAFGLIGWVIVWRFVADPRRR